MNEQDLTILKRNEIIRGHSDMFDLNAMRALNAVYWGIQKGAAHDVKGMVFEFSSLRKLMNLENDESYPKTIEKALKDLTKTIWLRNYCHIDGIEYKVYSMRFVDSVKITKAETNKVEVTFNPEMNKLLKEHENFTKLEFLKYSNSFRSKYTVALYEYLKSFESYKYIDMSMESLNTLLGCKTSYFSDLTKIIDRSLNDIKTKSDLDHIKKRNFKKDKYIRFYLNPNGNKNSVKRLLKSDQLFNTF